MGRAAAKRPEAIPPTPEQANRGEFTIGDVVDKGANGVSITLGKAYRRKPMIDTLHEQGLFSDDEYKALKHYRHHADIADKSPLRDSLLNLGRISTGSGNGPTITTLNAIRVRDDVERAAGTLVDILRAVVVDDVSLSEWCVRRGQSSEKCRNKPSGRVCKIEANAKALDIAKLEIQLAAKRVQAELDA